MVEGWLADEKMCQSYQNNKYRGKPQWVYVNLMLLLNKLLGTTLGRKTENHTSNLGHYVIFCVLYDFVTDWLNLLLSDTIPFIELFLLMMPFVIHLCWRLSILDKITRSHRLRIRHHWRLQPDGEYLQDLSGLCVRWRNRENTIFWLCGAKSRQIRSVDKLAE